MPKKEPKKKKKKDKKSALRRETKKSVVVVICVALALVSILSFFGLAGIIGDYFYKFSRLFLGRGFFLITVGLILVSLAILTSKFNLGETKRSIYQPASIGTAVFILSILGIFHIFAFPDIVFNGNLLSASANGGGYLGLVVGYPLIRLLGFWASLIILLAVLVISILVTFNIPIPFFVKKKDEIIQSDQPDSASDKLITDSNNNEEKQKQGLLSRIKEKAGEIKKRKEINSNIATKQKPVTAASVEASGLENKFMPTVSNFKLPPLDFLEEDKGQPTSGDIKANINIIKRTLENFGIEVEMAEVNVGPTVTQYTLRPAQGIKLARITALQNDLALALAAHPLRIEAPIPGRSLVGIEIPNRSVVMVRLRSLLEVESFQKGSLLTFALGRDVAGNPVFADLTSMPHLLIAGATGSGKTIGLNDIIISLLYKNSPESLKLILIDPKRVELTAYESITHLLTPVIVQPDKAVGALRWAVGEMERRFEILRKAGKRDINAYLSNLAKKTKKKGKQSDTEEENLPFIVVVIDELADLMSTHGREAEAAIVRLAQMARAVGIHLIVSTQRPSVEVITGLIKANITSRVAFQVASQIDSRTILDTAGADKLLGNGDMLFLSGSSAKPRRIQGAFISEKEVRKVTDYLRGLQEPDYAEEVTLGPAPAGHFANFSNNGEDVDDELYGEAKTVVVQAGKASASLLQRRLRIGYARAARLIDILEEKGVVGPADGAKPREVYVDEGENL